MKFYKKENTDTNICQCVQRNKPSPGHIFPGNKWWNIDKTMLPVHYWNTNEKEEEKKPIAQAAARLFGLHANVKKSSYLFK